MVHTDHNVARFLPERAARQPEHPAVRLPIGMNGELIRYRELSFAELEVQSNACLSYFRSKELKRGMRTLVMVKPGLELILSIFALFKLGAVPVVIDPGMGIRSFLNCVRTTRPGALVGIPVAAILSHVFRTSFKTLKHRVGVGSIAFKAGLRKYTGTSVEHAQCSEDELAAILFTSGSTGPPKGVLYQHGQFNAQVRMIRDAYSIEPGEVDLPMLPIFALFNPALGMTTVVPQMNPSRPSKADPSKLVQAIRQNEITNSFGSPVLWGNIIRHCQKEGITLPSLKRILMAGCAVPEQVIADAREIFPKATVHTPYGATECLPVCSFDGPTILQETAPFTRKGKGTCIGNPLPGMKMRIIRIADAAIERIEEVQELTTGDIGEIIVSGPVVTPGYDQLPEATAKAKIWEGKSLWHRMGDCGYLDEQGRLWFCGRVVERVVLEDGTTLYTDCVEAIFNQHPKVYRTALIQYCPAEPAVIIEPEKNTLTDEPLRSELIHLAKTNTVTERITRVFFHKGFPVDVRHNAKISRLALAREFAGK